MKEIELHAGTSIEESLKKIKKEAKNINEICYATFNGVKIYSSDTLDVAYVKITGKTYSEFNKEIEREREEYKKKEEEHKAKIPTLTEEYRTRARGLVKDSELEYWDKVVPVRLGDLYQGMELEETLNACAVMRDMEIPYADRLKKAYNHFMNAGHSGMSAGLVANMIKIFCPDGEDLADAVMNFRFEEK